MSYDPFFVYQNSDSEDWTGPYRLLKDMPFDMTAKILQKMELYELVKLRLTCSAMNNAIADIPGKSFRVPIKDEYRLVLIVREKVVEYRVLNISRYRTPYLDNFKNSENSDCYLDDLTEIIQDPILDLKGVLLESVDLYDKGGHYMKHRAKILEVVSKNRFTRYTMFVNSPFPEATIDLAAIVKPENLNMLSAPDLEAIFSCNALENNNLSAVLSPLTGTNFSLPGICRKMKQLQSVDLEDVPIHQIINLINSLHACAYVGNLRGMSITFESREPFFIPRRVNELPIETVHMESPPHPLRTNFAGIMITSSQYLKVLEKRVEYRGRLLDSYKITIVFNEKSTSVYEEILSGLLRFRH